jgi:hypothetical protein
MFCGCCDDEPAPKEGYYEMRGNQEKKGGRTPHGHHMSRNHSDNSTHSVDEQRSLAQNEDTARAQKILGSATGTFHIPADQLLIHEDKLLGKGTSAR